MKNNIQKNEMKISLLNKINGIGKLTKSQKIDLEIGLDVYLQIRLCGNIGSESWCEENLNKEEFIYFMEYIGKDLEKVNVCDLLTNVPNSNIDSNNIFLIIYNFNTLPPLVYIIQLFLL
jgi:hypothetical protein